MATVSEIIARQAAAARARQAQLAARRRAQARRIKIEQGIRTRRRRAEEKAAQQASLITAPAAPTEERPVDFDIAEDVPEPEQPIQPTPDFREPEVLPQEQRAFALTQIAGISPAVPGALGVQKVEDAEFPETFGVAGFQVPLGREQETVSLAPQPLVEDVPFFPTISSVFGATTGVSRGFGEAVAGDIGGQVTGGITGAGFLAIPFAGPAIAAETITQEFLRDFLSPKFTPEQETDIRGLTITPTVGTAQFLGVTPPTEVEKGLPVSEKLFLEATARPAAPERIAAGLVSFAVERPVEFGLTLTGTGVVGAAKGKILGKTFEVTKLKGVRAGEIGETFIQPAKAPPVTATKFTVGKPFLRTVTTKEVLGPIPKPFAKATVRGFEIVKPSGLKLVKAEHTLEVVGKTTAKTFRGEFFEPILKTVKVKTRKAPVAEELITLRTTPVTFKQFEGLPGGVKVTAGKVLLGKPVGFPKPPEAFKVTRYKPAPGFKPTPFKLGPAERPAVSAAARARAATFGFGPRAPKLGLKVAAKPARARAPIVSVKPVSGRGFVFFPGATRVGFEEDLAFAPVPASMQLTAPVVSVRERERRIGLGVAPALAAARITTPAAGRAAILGVTPALTTVQITTPVTTPAFKTTQLTGLRTRTPARITTPMVDLDLARPMRGGPFAVPFLPGLRPPVPGRRAKKKKRGKPLPRRFKPSLIGATFDIGIARTPSIVTGFGIRGKVRKKRKGKSKKGGR